MRACSLNYPAFKADAQCYIVITALSDSTVFFHSKIFPHKKIIEDSVFVSVCWFSEQLLSETFLIRRRIQRDALINVRGSSRKILVILVSFNKSWNFSTDFRTVLKYKFHENASAGSPVVPCGQSNWKTDMTTVMVAFRNICNAPINRHVPGEGAPLPAIMLECFQPFDMAD